MPLVPQHLAEWDHVIILHPDDVFGFDQRAGRVGEAVVDAVIAAFEIAGIFGQVDAIVKERPERLVGVTVIIFVYVLLFEIDRRRLDAFIFGKADMAGEIFGDFARPTDPDAPAFP